jgi:hypothetical protein
MKQPITDTQLFPQTFLFNQFAFRSTWVMRGDNFLCSILKVWSWLHYDCKIILINRKLIIYSLQITLITQITLISYYFGFQILWDGIIFAKYLGFCLDGQNDQNVGKTYLFENFVTAIVDLRETAIFSWQIYSYK